MYNRVTMKDAEYDRFYYCSISLSLDHDRVVREMIVMMSKLGILTPLVCIESYGDGCGTQYMERT